MINLNNILENNNCVVVSFNELKPYFINLKSANPSLNFKFLSINEIKKNTYGVSNECAIKLGLDNFNYDYPTIKTFLNYIKSGINVEVNEDINKYYNLLIENNFLLVEKDYKLIFKDKLVLFLGFEKDDIEINHLISKLNITNFTFINLSEIFDKKEIFVRKYLRVDEEIHDVFIRIIDLLNNSEKVSNIQIVTDFNRNYFYLNLYSKLLKLELNFKDRDSLYETKIAKTIEKNIDKLSEETIKNYDDGSDEYNLIVKYLSFYDFYNLTNKYVNYKAILSDVLLSSFIESEGIVVTNKFNFDIDKRTFLIGFDDSFFSKIAKNNEFFDDNVKILNNLNSSEIVNKENNKLLLNYLMAMNKLELYYGKSDGENKSEISYYLSIIYPDSNDYNSHIIDRLFYNYDYSKSIALSYYSYYYELARQYKERTTFYYMYDQSISKMLTRYDNQYKGISNRVNKYYKISYTQLNEFFSCPFKFYASRVLGLNTFEDNFYLNAGNFIHEIMEKVYDNDFDFEKVFDSLLLKNKNKFNNIELLYLDKLKNAAKIITDRLIAEKENSFIAKTFSEREFNIPINDKYILNGKVDSILIAENNDRKAVQIIDYKTGETELNLSKNIYGLGLQLPIYSYFLEKDKEFKEINIQGIYYINFISKILFDYDNDQIDLIKKKFLKNGAFTNSIDDLKLFEPKIIDYLDSKTIDKLGISKDGEIKKANIFDFSKPIKIMNEIYPCLIDQNIKVFIDYIENNKYPVSPFYDSETNNSFSCNFCEYKDLCFVNKKNRRIKETLETMYANEKGSK